MNVNSCDIGAFIACRTGTVPAARAAGARNGTAIDRGSFSSCVLSVQAGAASGAPTAIEFGAKLQHSDDGATDWTDYEGAEVELTEASTIAEADVDLSGAKQFIRVVESLAFTGGTTPTLGTASQVVLGGPDHLPV